MIISKVEQEVRDILTKDELVQRVISLANPSTEVSGSGVQAALGREHFNPTYMGILQQFGPIVVEDLFSEHKEAEGGNLIICLGKGREALEKEIRFLEVFDQTIDLWTYWKRNMYIDETLQPEEYENAIDGQQLQGIARSFQRELISKQQKEWALLGAFTWALARGIPGQAINNLEYVARIQESTPGALIMHFEPVLSLMHKKAADLDQGVVQKGGLDALGGRPAGEYLLEMDQGMMEQGYQFDENHAIKPLPIAVK